MVEKSFCLLDVFRFSMNMWYILDMFRYVLEMFGYFYTWLNLYVLDMLRYGLKVFYICLDVFRYGFNMN